MSPVSSLQATRRQGADGISDATTLRTQRLARGSPRFPASGGSAWRGEPGGVEEAEGQGALWRAGGRLDRQQPPPHSHHAPLRGPEVPGKASRERAGLEQCRALSLEEPRAAEAEWGKGNVITET